MEVRKGFKQTDVGVIPNDWDVKRLGEIGEAIIGLTYKPTDVRPSGTLVLRSSNVQDGSLRFDDNVFVDTDISEKLMVRNGDILVCVRNGSRDLIGKSAYIDDRAKGMTFGAFMTVFRSAHHAFAYHQFQFRIIKRQIHEHLGATINQITNKSLNSFAIPLPPTLAEQEAIAEALSDADAFIEAVEQLLTKKRQVKQGAMSELLTGKRRLSGFSGIWEARKLGEIAEIVSGGTPSTRIAEYWDGDIDWCTPTDITRTEGKYLTNTESRITEAGLKNSSANLLPKGAILLCSRATIGEVKIATGRICTNQGFKSLICTDQVYNEFLYYVVLTMKSKLIEKAIGSTFLEITKKEISSIEIIIPPVPEQTAIAEILSDIDAEITALEEKLVKARQVKQGMMQELLMGKIRLV